MKYKSIQSLEMCFAIHLIKNSLYCIFINEICRGKNTTKKFSFKIGNVYWFKSTKVTYGVKWPKKFLLFLPHLSLLKLLINFIFAVQARWKAGFDCEIGTQNCCSGLTGKFYMSQNTSKKTKITTTFVVINNSVFVV